MARRYGKKRRHGRGGFTLPMAVVVPIAIQAIAIGKNAMGGPVGQAKAMNQLTGYFPGNPWDSHTFLGTWVPILAGCAVHWGASKAGINRMLGRARIPLFRI